MSKFPYRLISCIHKTLFRTILLFFILIFFSGVAFSEVIETKIHSDMVDVDYDLWIYTSKYAETSDSVHIVVFMDANLNFGSTVKNYLLSQSELNCHQVIALGIGHTGKYKRERRRDFIFPNPQNHRNPFGDCDKFYTFLKNEALPYLSKNYIGDRKIINQTIMGHSLSGLFSTYAMLQEERLFDHVVAFSPSLWVKKRQIIRYVETDSIETPTPTERPSYYLVYGSLERSNRVAGSSKWFLSELNTRKPHSIKVHSKVVYGKGHQTHSEYMLQLLLGRILAPNLE